MIAGTAAPLILPSLLGTGGGFGVKGDKTGNIYMVQGAAQYILRCMHVPSCTPTYRQNKSSLPR